MELHDQLLALTRSLVPRFLDSTQPPPPQANLRRGISTAYYALFHLLVAEAVTHIAVDPVIRALVARSFKHEKMKQVCKDYSEFKPAGSGSPTLKSGAGIPPAELQSIGASFVSLQDARHQADYDIGVIFTHEDADKFISSAETAFLDWNKIQGDPAAAVFLGTLFLRSVTR